MFDPTMPYSSDYLPKNIETPKLNSEIATKILKRSANSMQFTRITRSPSTITSAATPNYDNIQHVEQTSINDIVDLIIKHAGSHIIVYSGKTVIMQAMAHKDLRNRYAYKVMVNYQDGLDFYDINTYYISLYDTINALTECVKYGTNHTLIAKYGVNIIVVETNYTSEYYPLETYIVTPTPYYYDNGHSQAFEPKPGSNWRGD